MEIVDEALLRKKKIRPVGSGMSWSPLCDADGQYIVMFHKMHDVTVSPDGSLVTVEPGALLVDVQRALTEVGRAWPCAPLGSHMTVVGAVSTGAHGSGKKSMLLSDLVERVEMVVYEETSRGPRSCIVDISRSGDPDKLKAAQVSLGCLGLIVSMTLRTLPEVKLMRKDVVRPASILMSEDKLHQLVSIHDYTTITWVPSCEEVLVRTCRPATATDLQVVATHQGPRMANAPDVQIDVAASIGGVSALKYLQKQPSFSATLTQRLMSALRQSLVTDGTEILLTSGSVRRTGMALSSSAPLRSCGFTFPVPTQDMSAVVTAFCELQDLIRDCALERKHPLVMLATVTFTKSSPREHAPLLSPATAPDTYVVCCIDVLAAYKEGDWEEFMQSLCRRWKGVELLAVPQWAREFPSTPEMFEHVRDCFGDRMLRFERVRKQLDPRNLFLNNYLQCVLDGW